MPRKKKPARAKDTKLHTNAGAAASLLNEQLAGIGAAMQSCLRQWENAHGGEIDDADYYLTSAVQLAEAAAKLGDSIARIKGESRQHIQVERVAHGEKNGPYVPRGADAKALNTQKESVPA